MSRKVSCALRTCFLHCKSVLDRRLVNFSRMSSASDQWQIGNFCCNANCAVANPTFTCTRCLMFKYCSTDCQHQAWKSGHKRICKKPPDLNEAPVSETTLRSMRLLIQGTDHMFEKKEFDDILSCSSEIMSSAYLWRMTDIPIAAMMLYTKLADCHKRKGEFTLALELLQLSLVLAQKLDRADICPLKLSGQVPKELYDSKVLEIQNQIASMYCNLSRIYCMMEQYIKAVSASKESLCLSKKLENRDQVRKSRQSLGRCLFWTGKYEDALVLHLETLSIVHNDDLVREKFETIVLLKLQIAQCHSLKCCFEAAIDIRKEVWGLLREMSLQCNVCTVSLDCQGCNQFKILTCIAIGIDLRSRAYLYTVTDKESKNTNYMQTLHEASHWFDTAIGLSYCHNLMYIKNDVLLHLAFNLFEIGSEELGMAKLKKHLDTQLTIKNKVCMGCQTVPTCSILVCSGCHVVGFCDKNHQMIASGRKLSGFPRDEILGHNVVRHKDICPLLDEWRRIAKTTVSADSRKEACADQHREFLKGPAWHKARKHKS